MPSWPISTSSAVNRWIVPRAVMCSLFWTGVLLVFTGMILLVTSKHKGTMYESWGAVLLGLGLCFLLVCLILCVHAYRVTSILNREEPTNRTPVNFAETVDPPYNAPSMTTASVLANGRKPRSIGTLVAPPKYGVNIQQPPVRRIIPPPSYLTNKDPSPVAAAPPAPPIVRWFAADSVDYQDVKPPKPLSPIAEGSTPPTLTSNDSEQVQVIASSSFHRKRSLTDRSFQEASDVILNSLTPASNLSSNYVVPSSPTSPSGNPERRTSGVSFKTTSVKFDTGKYTPYYSENSKSQLDNPAQNKSTLRKDSREIISSELEQFVGRATHARFSVDSESLSALGFSSATLPRESHFRHVDQISTLPMDKSGKSTRERDEDGNSSSRPDSNFTSVETIVAAGSLARLRSLAQEPQRPPPPQQRSPQTISSSSRSDNLKTNFLNTPTRDTIHVDLTKASGSVSHSELRRPLQRQNRLPDGSMDFRDDDGCESRHPTSSGVISTPAEVHHLATTTQRKIMPDSNRSTVDNIHANPSSQHSLSRSVTRTFGQASVTVTPLEKHSDGGDTWRRTTGHRGNEDDVIEGKINRRMSRPDPGSFAYDTRARVPHDEAAYSHVTRHDRLHDEGIATVHTVGLPRRGGGGGAFIPVDPRDIVTLDREQIKGREEMDAAQKRFELQHPYHRPSGAGFSKEESCIYTHRTDSDLSGDIDSARMLDERTRMCDNVENLSNIVNAFEDTTSKATVYDNVQYFRM